MRIGVLGAGVMADALGTRWAAAGHEMMIAGRTAGKAEQLARKWGGQVGSFREAAQFGDLVLISVLYQGMPATLAEVGNTLRGKPILDCNNPVEIEHFTLVTEPGRSMAQDIQQATGGHVVKAFNLCQARVWQMDPPVFDGRRLVVPYCTDHPAAAELARHLIADIVRRPSGRRPRGGTSAITMSESGRHRARNTATRLTYWSTVVEVSPRWTTHQHR